METSFQYFWSQMVQNPLLFLAVALTLGVILVNGWTDAPNAIATCVVTRCMSARAAIVMAAIFNFLGVYVMTMLSPKVAETITKMVNFGTNPDQAIIALSAAMFAIVNRSINIYPAEKHQYQIDSNNHPIEIFYQIFAIYLDFSDFQGVVGNVFDGKLHRRIFRTSLRHKIRNILKKPLSETGRANTESRCELVLVNLKFIL